MLQRPFHTLPLLLLGATLVPAQKTFDVATIKPNAANDNRIMIGFQPGGRFRASGITMKLLLGQAYNVRDFQIENAPGWLSTERWDIEAKAEGLPDRVPPEQMRPMLQALLQERLQLKTHKDTKELPVYALVVAKGGHKMTASTSGDGPGQRMMRMGRGQINAQGASMTMIANQLSQMLGRTVIDKTELSGNFEVKLEWTPDGAGHGGGGPFGGAPPPDAVAGPGGSGPSIFTALQEQLGLRLESTKGPVEIIVIDHVAKPTDN